ncbi:hypothetical protein MLD38_019839 [Melastoma candidum]|uniref:Uncharacterized protein n=1 Tax=Melastoma candidum TaxID=119954 RepID=A0ACB9QEV3_9MYRT|nr:hypothetical protein MLD38_019839 [Melastoma candidum]
MVSQRQRVARKRCRESHPELFPASFHTDKPNNKYKKNKLSNLKKKKNKKNASVTIGVDPSKATKGSLKRHPLRVPGMMPGQGCFICRGQDHIAKLCPQKSHWDKNKICLLCRRRGHSLKHCPNNDDGSVVDKKICYNCGDTSHSLASCPRPLQDGGTKFASCFICNERGHLSKNCPKSTRGIYPKGGCCKTCGGVTHLAKDCPEKGKKSLGLISRRVFESEEMPRPQVTKFTSGDDLEDDFAVDKKEVASSTADATSTGSGHAKTKKKPGTKIVNFVG